ncbi:MAG: hypothetical protein H6983_02320 [Ectothiorhodospiraceae bacterium]|nr:hypothetical protein [Ectothiorhodospiraceae bacterium]
MALIRFEETARTPYAEGRVFGDVGAFVQVDGVAHFAVDPTHPANRAIVDLALAPRDADGRVRFEADLSVVMPVEPDRGAGRLLVELPNRGRRRVVPVLDRAPADAPVAREAHPGDGFLFRHGWTVASIGWQWDVYRDPSMMGLEAPLAMDGARPLGGETVVEIRPSTPGRTYLLADRIHRPLPAADVDEPGARLLVRDYEDGEDRVVPRDAWRFAVEREDGRVEPSAEHVHLAGGFEPGRIYHLVYRTDRAPVAGCGLLALRDVAPFLRTPSQINPTAGGFRTVLAWGVSQTGRMLRHYLSLGLNLTEDGEVAYDGLLPHVAGARRGAFNHRFAQPSNQTTPIWGHLFPFADVPTRDASTGVEAGLLDRQRALGAVPKVISTNSAAEYWRGDATLAHVDTAAAHDLPEAPETRSYLFASTQHGAGYLGQSRFNPGVNTTARYPLDVLDYRPLLRAALVNMTRWVEDGVEPPPSRHPRLADGSAVDRRAVVEWFARLPGFEPPDPDRLPFVRTVDMGAPESVGVGRYPAREGAFYPALVSAIDADGNEVAGIRLPDVTVPVGTHAGWNPRDPETGAPEQIVPMNGLTLWFPATRAARAASGDPRPSVEERYRDRADYEARVRAATAVLVRDRYVLDEDAEHVVAAALERFDAAVGA